MTAAGAGPAAGRRVCVVGDVLLDVVVKLDGPIRPDTDTYGTTAVGAGGQAANVAAWVVALGGEAVLVGKLAADPAARLVCEELRRRGVQVCSPPPSGGGRTGTVVSVATPDGRRTMLTDRGVAADLHPDELDPAWFEGCGWLHVPAYSLASAPLRAATQAVAARLPAGAVSVDYSSVAVIEALGVARFRELVLTLRPSVTFANEQEAELVGPLPPPPAGPAVSVVKLGAGGCLVDGQRHPARLVEAVDTTGAGDAFAAGWLLGGTALALHAARRCVTRLGAMP